MFTFSGGCAAGTRGHISQLLSNSPAKHGAKRAIIQAVHRRPTDKRGDIPTHTFWFRLTDIFFISV